MSDIQVTVNSRSLERVFWIVAILVLAGMNVHQWMSDDSPDQLTGMVTENTQMAESQEEEQEALQTEETCTDGVKNQDETNIDCGGTCGGYWYDNGCHSDPEQEIECRLNSDCDSGFKCEDNMCVEIPPECEVDDDCGYLEECIDQKCEEKQLSGTIDVDILKVEDGSGTGENTRKIKSVKLEIENGERDKVFLYGKAFVYESKSDPMYGVSQGGDFDIGSVASGEVLSAFFNINGISFPDDGEARKVRIEVYDDDDNLVDTVTESFYS